MMKAKLIPALAAAMLILATGAYAQQRMGMMSGDQEQADEDMPMMGPGMGSMAGGMMAGGMGMMGGMGIMGGGMRGHGMGMGYMMSPAMMQMLDLSPEQKAKISQIQAQARKKQWQIMGDLREERIRLQELMSSDTPDPAAATAQYQKVQDLERRLFEGALVARNQVDAALTPEQKEELKSAMMAQGIGRHGMGPMHRGAKQN
jgi:Spy/CpxP family protein refolding chaperone